jgi:integrase
MDQQVLKPPQRRARQKQFTDAMVAALKVKTKPYTEPDPELRLHFVRVYESGEKAFYVRKRDRYGKLRWIRIGRVGDISIAESREIAREVIKRLDAGQEPFPPEPVKPDTVADVVENYFRRHVEPRGTITAQEKLRVITKHVLPHWGRRPFIEMMTRSNIARLLDAVEDAHGAWVADKVLTELSGIASWYASRNDGFTPPFVRNMRRVPAHLQKRTNLLSDEQIRSIVRTATELSAADLAARSNHELRTVSGAAFARLVMVLLLGGQRLAKTVEMRWDNLASDGTWIIPSASAREKGTAGSLKLPPLALQFIHAQPHLASNPYVFAGRGSRAMSGFSALKRNFDKRAGVGDYSLHDLRRCCRSLMSRAGIASHIAERVLGHAQPGIQAVYDVHRYDVEKADALLKLVDLIEHIFNPLGDNVVHIGRRS